MVMLTLGLNVRCMDRCMDRTDAVLALVRFPYLFHKYFLWAHKWERYYFRHWGYSSKGVSPVLCLGAHILFGETEVKTKPGDGTEIDGEGVDGGHFSCGDQRKPPC